MRVMLARIQMMVMSMMQITRRVIHLKMRLLLVIQLGMFRLNGTRMKSTLDMILLGKRLRKKREGTNLIPFLPVLIIRKIGVKFYDEYNDEIVELTKEETRMIRRVLKGMAPHPEFDPYPTAGDWVSLDPIDHPFPDAPEPKRRFVPSKWESKMIVRLVRGIRKGLIKVDDKPKEENRVYLLWGDDPNLTERHHIPPSKPKCQVTRNLKILL
ncbi:hypothetical protein ACH5RR_022597 [Cinchona calisaya]|uniref:BOP1 N-terminal domain-containing protein n=1 Tax=Cinchona calisaya TaxID=153742 RepID=A0ABD2ZBJ0_9GENT